MKISDILGVDGARVSEAAQDHILVSMMRKLQPHIGIFGSVYYTASDFESRKKVVSLNFEPKYAEGGVDVGVAAKTGGTWAATLSTNLLNHFTIKSFKEGDQKMWVIIPKHAIDQVKDVP